MKVIIQISEKEKIPMGNVVGSHVAREDDVEAVEIVFLESATIATTKIDMIKPLMENKKITVMACKTSMEMNNIKKEDLVPNISPTPQGGFLEILRKERDGYLYIHV
jgi:intracellular sulfur oxidation DsrE/DsrF family protein